MGKWLGEQMIIYKFFKAALRSREAFIMSEFLLVVVVVVSVCCLVSWHFSSPVIGRHKKCCLVIGYNVSSISSP